ncbi:MAG: caspase family protein [Planctomycetes bacterium]|nr:caspase family protein [Planctomycetota bacterium]
MVGGDRLTADLTSNDFDTYVAVLLPGAETPLTNDDYNGSRSHSRIEAQATQAGTAAVVVTSYKAGETGAYRLTLSHERAGGGGGGGAMAPIVVGRLEAGGEQIDGRFCRTYTQTCRAGEALVVDLHSRDFDTFLRLQSPTGRLLTNDDFISTRWSRLVVPACEAGQYKVTVSAYNENGTGDYWASAERIAPGEGLRVIEGSLQSGDDCLSSGEYRDVHTFTARAGETACVELIGEGFNAYLIVVGPDGAQVENDDRAGGVGDSCVILPIERTGDYRAVATSAAAGETGRYTLLVHRRSEQREVHHGRLSADDRRQDGKHVDTYGFTGRAGRRMRVELRSEEFDACLVVRTPGGKELTDDDGGTRGRDSLLMLCLEEDGPYEVRATSLNAGETGAYTLEIAEDEGTVGGGVQDGTPPPATAPSDTQGGAVPLVEDFRNVYGVFVGINDYSAQGATCFTECVGDARRAMEALAGMGMPSENAVFLSDAQATAGQVADALRRMGRQVREGGMLVFFYSGHGAEQDRPADRAPDVHDMDGKDEVLCLYDGDMTDDDLAELLDPADQGLVMVILDSCYSGGFLKEITARPRRVGMFSSEEGIASFAASQFQAGGYLAHFFADGLRRSGEQGSLNCDANLDGMVTIFELKEYIHERYRTQVKSTRQLRDVPQTQVSNQHFVFGSSCPDLFSALFARHRGKDAVAGRTP